jgi:hypothetical protein
MRLPKKIELKVDETYTLTLPGWGTTGIFRTYEVIQVSQVVDVLQVDVGNDDEDLEEPKPGGDIRVITGASKDEVFKIRGLRPGSSMIQFFKHFAGKDERQREHLLEVDVKG